MDVTDAITNLIETVIREEFGDDVIESVKVIEALDYQEDRVFKVTVVFDKRGGLDPEKTTAIVRLIRSKLSEAKEDPVFPILSFVSKGDAASLSAETA